MNPGAPATVAVVGGGLAGLAAGCALAGAGFRVRLFERRSYLGGRASSYQLPGTNDTVDNCQHLLLGCCTNLLGFYRRIGVDDRIRWYDRLTFLEPGGRRSDILPSWLPAPLHGAPSFLGSRVLGMRDKLAIARGLSALLHRIPPDDGRAFCAWLAQHRQTELAVRRFWKPVLVSALNEDLDRVSVNYAAQVFRESFLKSPQAGRIGLPALPLSDLYSFAGDYIRARGGEVLLRAAVDEVKAGERAVRLCVAGAEHAADYVVHAVPWHVLPRMVRGAPVGEQGSALESSPITGIHFWFDRPVTGLPHAALLDRTIQWMFNKSQILGEERAEDGAPVPQHIELVVSSSKSLVAMSRSDILELARRELAEFFPEAARAFVVRSTVIKEVHATFSVLPGADRMRPRQQTSHPRVFLAGDWTATGWPATMEGAVRSGFLAAEALTRHAGQPQPFLLPDLPATGLMRLFD